MVLLAHWAWPARRSCSSTRSASTTSSSTRSTGRGRDLDAKAPDLFYCVAGPFGAHTHYLFSAYSLCLLASAKSAVATTTRPARGDGPRGDPEFSVMDLARGSNAPRRDGGHGRGRARVKLPRANRDGRGSSPGSDGALGLSVRGFGLRIGLSGLSAGLRLRCSGLRAPRRRLGACVSRVRIGG